MHAEHSQFQALIQYNLTRFQTDLARNNLQAIQKKPAQVMRVLQRALPVVELWPTIQNFMADLAPLMERWGQWSGWQQLLGQCLRLAQQRQDERSELTLHVLSARLAQRQHHLDEVITHYRQAIRLAKRQPNQELLATACTNLGYLYIELGFYWRAEILCYYALNLFEHLNHGSGLAHTKNHLGVLYLRQERWDAAEEHLQRACEIWQAMGDKPGLMWGWLNLGIKYRNSGDIQTSSTYLKKALNHAQAIDNQTEIANIYNSLGVNYVALGQLDEGVRAYQQAETIFRQLSDLLSIGHVMNNLGVLFMEQQQWHRAEQYFEAALRYYEQTGHTQFCSKIQRQIVHIRQRMNDEGLLAVRPTDLRLGTTDYDDLSSNHHHHNSH